MPSRFDWQNGSESISLVAISALASWLNVLSSLHRRASRAEYYFSVALWLAEAAWVIDSPKP